MFFHTDLFNLINNHTTTHNFTWAHSVDVSPYIAMLYVSTGVTV